MRKRVAAILFDLDGTLVDTAPDLGHAANFVRGECGLAPLPLAVYRPAASAGARGLLKLALDMAPDHADFPQRRDSFLAHYRAHLTQTSKPFPGIPELLLQLELRGLRWGVVTNKPAWLTEPLMHGLNLAARCACTVSGDSTPHPKPAPDPLLLACRQLALKPAQCIYVGDDFRDIESARAAGMPCAAAAWGYIGDRSDIASWNADAVAQHPGDVIAIAGI